MHRSRFLGLVALAPLLAISCSSSNNRPAADGGGDRPIPPEDLPTEPVSPPPDVAPEIRPDIPGDLAADKLPDLPYGAEVGPEAGVEVGREVAAQADGGDTATSAETGREVAAQADVGDTATSAETGAVDRAQTCWWQKSGGRYGLSHFTFGLTTPDGQAQSPPSYNTRDGATQWSVHDFEGSVTKQIGNQLTVDSCDSSQPCQPSLYRFTVCQGALGTCGGVDSGAELSIPVPVGRRVRVVWHLDNDVPGFCPGLYFLAVYDAQPGPTRGNILFLGSGGRSASVASTTSNPLNDLPFSVATEALWCGAEKRDVAWRGDDYAFVLTPKSGSGGPLRIETGQSGSLDVVAPQGGSQRLQLHCIVAVQPQGTDDYWNWDFWGTGEVLATPVDGGGGG